ncbi:hypothetical protein WJX75_008793 [Coccomyxa subellipsoidea]|uniref:Uncharacterized protein n=1 Tax=Coccomyxa subellipsoidea TaxID=248742 RepID=A0ABR2YK92_9CHLO
MFFRDDYWKLVAPSLTSLTLGFGDFEFLEKVPHHWLQLLLLLRNLEVLELSAIGYPGNVHFEAPAELTVFRC